VTSVEISGNNGRHVIHVDVSVLVEQFGLADEMFGLFVSERLI
jgi:hypothetical protein